MLLALGASAPVCTSGTRTWCPESHAQTGFLVLLGRAECFAQCSQPLLPFRIGYSSLFEVLRVFFILFPRTFHAKVYKPADLGMQWAALGRAARSCSG